MTLTALVVGSCLAFSQGPAPQSNPEQPTVKMNLLVTDSKDRSVEDVTQDEVQIVEDGQPLTISLFAKDSRPTQYVIALDSSGSFRGIIERALDFVRLLIRGMRSGDQIQLIRFISSDKIVSLTDFTSDQSKLADSLKLVRIESGQSAVIDATYEAVRSVANHRRSESIRRAVVLISDGEDRASFYNSEALVKLLRKETVQVFVVGIVLDLENTAALIQRGTPRQKAEKLLKTVASESGGRVFFPRTNGDLVQAATEIRQNLQTSYVLEFHPPNSGRNGFRTINVKIAKRGGEELKARTRPGYTLDTTATDEKGRKNPN